MLEHDEHVRRHGSDLSLPQWVWQRLSENHWEELNTFKDLELRVLALYRCTGASYEEAMLRCQQIWTLKVVLDGKS
jgi:hypothetical protein